MKNLKLIFGVAAIAIGSMAAFSFGPTKEKEVTKKESKAALYWFDASTNAYIGHSEDSGCDESSPNLCSQGYTSVANPSNPVKPSGTPADVGLGIRN